MEQRKKNIASRAVGAVWRGIETAARVILVLFFLAILVGLFMLTRDHTPEVPESAALIIAPHGMLVEQLAGDPTDRAIQKLTGQQSPETLWRDLDDAIRAAKDDDRIQALCLYLNQMAGAGPGLSKLQALRAAINEFKTSGKPVIAYSDVYLRDSYHLASAADEVYLHRMGMVLLGGYSRFRTYYKEGIDKLELDWNVFRVGEYKSAVEPFLRNDMSEEARQANLEWMDDLWRSYLADVATARDTTPEALTDGIERFVDLIEQSKGDTAEMAQTNGLVDHLTDRDGLRDRMIELVGENEETHSFHQIRHGAYLEALGDKARRHPTQGDAVAVIVAKGSILAGSQPPGAIGGDSTGKLIRDARRNESVKAIVLRVDSGGGSAFASELIRRELVLAREAGKKVVVSMGTLAASGGYWISTASDEIWANPTTITGSIGIFGMIPTYQKPLKKYLGWQVDGVGTTWLAGAVRPDRELDPELGRAIQMMIEDGYREFLSRVAEARSMSVEEVDRIARGRVWSGQDAHEIGLVDNLGGLEDAIASAAAMAELGDDYAVRFIEKQPSLRERMARQFLSRATEWFGPAETTFRGAGVPTIQRSLLDLVRRQAEMLSSFNDPNGIYALCDCAVE
jgi:protease-4